MEEAKAELLGFAGDFEVDGEESAGNKDDPGRME